MKKFQTCLVILISTFFSYAQTGINYKAVLNDAAGNPIVNSLVVVQFSIYETTPTGTLVYQEDHTPTTDTNGLVILNIGLGNASSGVFEDIVWTSDDYFLNVQINTGSGFTDLGTTQIMAVPIAINAINAATAANVTGLEAIDEGNGLGWRLVGRNLENYGNIGLDAVDLSDSDGNSDVNGATGRRSFAFGRLAVASDNSAIAIGNGANASDTNAVALGTGVSASGFNSLATGSGTTASGFVSTAMGFQTISSGFHSTAMGRLTQASGTHATAMGFETRAQSFASVAIGRYNLAAGDELSWNELDPLFVIGNGTSDTERSNAVTVRKNGNVGIGTSAPGEILQIAGRLRFQGLETLEDGGGNEIASRADIRPSVDDQYDLGTPLFRWDDVYATNGTIITSDRREKTNIGVLKYGLETILKLKPVSFNWKSGFSRSPEQAKDLKLGLIAQDLLEVVPEVVKTHDWKFAEDESTEKTKVPLDRLGVYYSDLIPVLINAIQEQQTIIEGQQTQIDELRKIVQTNLKN